MGRGGLVAVPSVEVGTFIGPPRAWVTPGHDDDAAEYDAGGNQDENLYSDTNCQR